MSTNSNQQSTQTPPNGDDKNFFEKLINLIIAVLMILISVAKYHHWTDGIDAMEFVKLLLELVVLLFS